jgi:hypothetical protein
VENSSLWLAAIHPTFLNLRVKCLKGCLVSMTILNIFVSLHHLVLPQNDRRHFI